MKEVNFTINLNSDCEIGTGFTTELLDSIVPRDIESKPIIPASHIKGLIRNNLKNIFTLPKFNSEQIDTLLGKEGDNQGLLFITNAVTDSDKTITITRTRIGDNGIKEDGSLRTSEAIACDTKFKGELYIDSDDLYYVTLAKLGLLSIVCIGGNRNRGMGDCYITIDNENKTPGEYLKELLELAPKPMTPPPSVIKIDDKNGNIWLKINFTADKPICVPDTPVVSGKNVISSGFAIPATAIQGVILNAISKISDEAATSIYGSGNFRCCPLHPTNDRFNMSMKISSTYKISKEPSADGKYEYSDTSMEHLWKKDNDGKTNFKGADGVLIANDGQIELYRKSDMPRQITAHAVINKEENNLFTVEALAIKNFTGLISVPKDAVEWVKKAIGDKTVFIGKSKSIRGSGKIKIEKNFKISSLPQKYDRGNLKSEKSLENRVFVVQSPIIIPCCIDLQGKSDNEIIKEVVEDSCKFKVAEAYGNISTLFGRNNKRFNGITKARYIITSGSIFVLNEPVKDLEKFLLNGLGDNSDKAFGSVMPHFGVADSNYKAAEKHHTPKDDPNYAEIAYQLDKENEGKLSSSQVAALINVKNEEREKYLKDQLERKDIKDKWEKVKSTLQPHINDDKMLKVWHDLTVGGR